MFHVYRVFSSLGPDHNEEKNERRWTCQEEDEAINAERLLGPTPPPNGPWSVETIPANKDPNLLNSESLLKDLEINTPQEHP